MSGKLVAGNRSIFRVTFYNQDGTVIDISSASTKQIHFLLPSGTSIAKDGTFTTDGTDGVLEYQAEANFLTAGFIQYQGYAVVAGKEYTGGDIHGKPIIREVKPRLFTPTI